ncbi:MAG: hypothetical protein GTN76_03435 [Candidatus Aenigmarchaeota archaeon]|nr:hypothetical protein [Candidatus Aenigmarchaeota archaeon]
MFSREKPDRPTGFREDNYNLCAEGKPYFYRLSFLDVYGVLFLYKELEDLKEEK